MLEKYKEKIRRFVGVNPNIVMQEFNEEMLRRMEESVVIDNQCEKCGEKIAESGNTCKDCREEKEHLKSVTDMCKRLQDENKELYKELKLLSEQKKDLNEQLIKFEHMEINECEMVSHPNHYNMGSIEVIDVIEDWKLNFSQGNIIKYVGRCEYKGNKIEDLKKARFYIGREIDRAISEEGRADIGKASNWVEADSGNSNK